MDQLRQRAHGAPWSGAAGGSGAVEIIISGKVFYVMLINFLGRTPWIQAAGIIIAVTGSVFTLVVVFQGSILDFASPEVALADGVRLEQYAKRLKFFVTVCVALASLVVGVAAALFSHLVISRPQQAAQGAIIHGVEKVRDVLFSKDESIVKSAASVLVVAGSRSRNKPYLDAIEEAMRRNSNIEYYRILYGPPRTGELQRHIVNIIKNHGHSLNDNGQRRINIAIIPAAGDDIETNLCANEKRAFIILPSFSEARRFDTGVLIEDEASLKGLRASIRGLCTDATRIDDPADARLSAPTPLTP